MPVDPQRLAPCALFTDFAAPDVAAIAAKMEERIAAPGERLMREGANGYSFFVVLSGEVEVTRAGASVVTLVTGDFFGEAAVLDNARRNATVTAVGETVVGELFGADLAKLDADSPEIHARLRGAIEARRPA